MSYAIVCEARKGTQMGITHLALVDRRKTTSSWWTSDDPSLVMRFESKEAAERQVKRLRYNFPKVLEYDNAIAWIQDQKEEIEEYESLSSCEEGWDGHKVWTGK